LGLNIIGLIEEDSWSPNGEQPSIQTAMDSLSMGPMKSETEGGCISAAGGAHIMSDFTKKERNSSIPSSPT
jgi:hypothetical protein